MRRDRGGNPVLLRGLLDCFVEPVIGRASARPVGSQGGGNPAERTVTGAGSGGTTVDCVPAGPDICAGAAPAGPGTGCAEAVVVDGGGAPPGSTTTRVPTLTRSNRSETSSFSMPMQPDETNLPMVEG